MNVLQVLPSLDVGGVETGTVDLVRYLVQNGHKAVVVSSGGRLTNEVTRAGARHYALPVHKKNILTMIRMARRLCDVIRQEEIDLVHARSRIPAWSAFFASRIMKKPFVTTAHGYYSRHLASEVMGWGRFVIVASHVMARRMMHDFGVPHTRIRLVPRGVDLGRFTFREPHERQSDEFAIGIISRITPLKGHTDFLKAVGILSRTIPRLRVVIVGDVPRGKEKYRAELELLTKRLGLARTVEFLGTQEDIPGILRGLDVVVSATVTQEAFGRSIIEAQASGVPVVATRVGGVVDIIEDGTNGILCTAQDPRDIARAIIAVYKDQDLRSRLVYNARRIVEERFTLERMAQETIAVYEEAVRQLNILVIKVSSIGDCILSIPSLRALRSAFKGATLKVLVGVSARDVFNNCPYIDDRIVCDLNGKDRGLWGLRRLARVLQKEYFDIVVDLQNNKKSHLLAFLSFASQRYGYDNGKWSFFLNRKVKEDHIPRDPIEHQSRTLALMGVDRVEKALELFPSADDERWAQQFLRANWIKPGQPLVGIALRASEKWLTKNWPLSHVAALCDRLGAKNIRTVITGTKEDAKLSPRLLKSVRSKPIMAVGKTSILELAALMRHFDCFITPDSAPLHVACGMGVRVIALFGPTDPSRHFVECAGSVVMKAQMKCGPCYSPHCMRNFKCMKAISVNEVFEAAEKAVFAVRVNGSGKAREGDAADAEDPREDAASRPFGERGGTRTT